MNLFYGSDFVIQVVSVSVLWVFSFNKSGHTHSSDLSV